MKKFPTIPAHKYKVEDLVTTHMLTLTNGEILFIEEIPQKQEINIGLGDTEEEFDCAEYFCKIDSEGVLVYTNGEFGTETISLFPWELYNPNYRKRIK